MDSHPSGGRAVPGGQPNVRSSKQERWAYWRTAIIGGASSALLLAAVGPASGVSGGGAAQAPAFTNGTAKATAVLSKVAPGVGALELGISSGIAVSEVTNSLAQAQAQALDLGLIGTTLTAEDCEGGDGYVRPEQLPAPTRVDNRKGDVEASSDDFPLAGPVFGGGREEARATTVPSASAVATSVASFSPIMRLSGGRAEATSEIIDGAARQAHALVEANLRIADVVELSGLRWDALHRTGREPDARATFDVGTARILGVPVDTASLSAVEAAANTALAPSGITVTFPTVERFTEPTDLVRVTPLRVVLKDSPVGKAALGPGLELTRAQRERMFDEFVAFYCQSAGLLLVGDITLSVVSGTGFLAIEVGGAEARSAEVTYENPFGAPIVPPGVALPGGVPGPAVLPGGAAPPGGIASDPTSVGGGAARPAASVGPLEVRCESIHPSRGLSCWHGALLPLGLLGLAATAVIGGLDWRHQRRRLASSPPSDPLIPA